MATSPVLAGTPPVTSTLALGPSAVPAPAPSATAPPDSSLHPDPSAQPSATAAPAPAPPPAIDPEANGPSQPPASSKEVVDPLTQLESALDLLLQIVASTVAYLTRKAPHVATRPDAPLSMLGATAATILVDEQTMAQNIEELVSDLVKHAGTVRSLMHDLPNYDEMIQGQPARLEGLQNEMRVANEEYASVVQEAKELQDQVGELLHQLWEEQQRLRVKAAEHKRSATDAWATPEPSPTTR